MANNPQLWNRLLDVCPEGSVIAGGAVRDWYDARQVKDIDIFVNNIDAELWEFPEWMRTQVRDEPAPEYRGMNGIRALLEFVIDDHETEHPVQVIFVDGRPVDQVRRFDLGICQCWYNGGVHIGRNAIRDFENRTITALTPDRPEVTRRRFERLSQKFVGFTFVPHPEAAEFMPENPAVEIVNNPVRVINWDAFLVRGV